MSCKSQSHSPVLSQEGSHTIQIRDILGVVASRQKVTVI